MTETSLSLVGTLRTVSSGVSGADAEKNTADGFQSLLDIGTPDRNEAERQRPPVRRADDGREVTAGYAEAPRVAVDDARPEQVAPQRTRIETEAQPEEKAPESAAPKDRPAGQDNAAQKPVADKEKSAGPVESADHSADRTARGDTSAIAGEQEPLRARVMTLLSSIIDTLSPQDGKPVPLADISQSLQQIQQLQKSLEGVSPELAARLQPLMERLNLALQSLASSVQPAPAGLPDVTSNPLAAAAVPTLPARLPQLEAVVAALRSLENTVSQAVQVELPAEAMSEAADDILMALRSAPADAANVKNTQASVPQAVQAQMEQAAVPVAQPGGAARADTAEPVLAAGQAAVKTDGGGASNQQFADTGSGQRDASSFATSSVRSTAPSAQVTASGASFSQMLNKTPAQPLMDQVMFHIKTMTATGNSRIHIQLNPAELGKLDIKLDVNTEGKTSITVTADNKSTLDLLQRDARGLERALADAGLKADSGSLNFNLRGEQDRGQHDPSHAARNYRQLLPEEEAPPLNVLTRSYVVNLAEGLDIKI